MNDTNDLVKVIRCKDCTYYEEKSKIGSYGYCYYWDYEQGMSPNKVDDDDFCSNGVKQNKS